MRRLLYVGALALSTVGLFAYGMIVSGKPSGSAVFLGFCGGALFISVEMMFRAARSLFIEPPAVEQAVATGRRRKELEREKTSLLKALKELDFDHEMRKVSDADFAEIGGAYRARAIRVMRQLDDRQVDYATLVEEELARHKKSAGIEPRTAPSAAPLSKPTAAASPLTCPACTTVNDVDAVFCKKCGHRFASLEVTA